MLCPLLVLCSLFLNAFSIIYFISMKKFYQAKDEEIEDTAEILEDKAKEIEEIAKKADVTEVGFIHKMKIRTKDEILS